MYAHSLYYSFENQDFVNQTFSLSRLQFFEYLNYYFHNLVDVSQTERLYLNFNSSHYFIYKKLHTKK